MNLVNKQSTTTDSPLLSFSNSTGSPTADAGNNIFSRANVFGIFLALAFCLLTQPYGSILYQRPSGILGRILFFFWRLNPLACAAEAFLIVSIFFSGTRVRWLDDNDDRFTPMTFRKKIHLVADAILFLRAYTHLPEHWAALADRRRWEAGDVIETQTRSTVLVDEAAAVPLLLEYSTDIVDERRLGYEREAPMQDSPPPYSQAEAVSEPAPGIAPASPATTHPTPSSGIQSENRAESGQQPCLEAEVAMAIRALRSGQTIMGGRKLTSAERLIHLISVLSVVVVIIKIAATNIPTYIHVAAWFMISGWAAVELLIALSHRDHDEAAHEATLVRCAFVLQSRLNGPFIWMVLYPLCFPVLLYLSHVAFYQTDDLARNNNWKPLARIQIINYFFCSMAWYNMIKDIRKCLPSWRRPQIRLGECVVPSCKPIRAPKIPSVAVTLVLITCWTVGVLVGYGYGMLEFEAYKCAANPTKGKCNVLLTSTSTIWMSIWFLGPAVVFSSSAVSQQGVRHRSMNVFQGASLIWNLSVTTLFFVIAMMLYRPETTYKPDWLDWLGKLHRWARGVNST